MFSKTKQKFFLLLIFFIPLVSFGNQNQYSSEEESNFKRTWHLDSKHSDNLASIYEWTKEDENVYNWTELITAHLIKNCYSKQQFYDHWLAPLRSMVPDSLWYEKIVSEDKDSILVLWAIFTQDEFAQKELAKIIETKDGLLLIRYTVKDDVTMDNKWLDCVLYTNYENNFLICE